jgi:hypothetical protein
MVGIYIQEYYEYATKLQLKNSDLLLIKDCFITFRSKDLENEVNSIACRSFVHFFGIFFHCLEYYIKITVKSGYSELSNPVHT